jgi:hypothetical protein
MKVWIGNLAPGTTVERIKQLLEKYGLPQPDGILPLLDGASPAVLIEFRTDGVTGAQNIRKLIWRIEGLYWEGAHITVTPLHSF